MTNQLMLQLPKVDEKATRAEVKKAFKQYHENQATLKAGGNGFLIGLSATPSSKVTATLPRNDADSIHGGKVMNTMNDMNELVDRLVQHQEREKAMMTYNDRINAVIANLPEEERLIIEHTLQTPPAQRKKDRDIWPDLGMGKQVYYSHKEKAMLRIAFALRIEVYELSEEAAAA